MLRGACWPLEARLPADLVAHVEFLCFASLRAELDAIPGSGPCAIPGSGPCGLRTDDEERAVRAADARIYALLCGAAVVTDALSGLPVVLGSLVLEPLHAVVLWRLVHARAFDAATPRTFRAWARVPFAPVLQELERDQERWRGRAWQGAWQGAWVSSTEWRRQRAAALLRRAAA